VIRWALRMLDSIWLPAMSSLFVVGSPRRKPVRGAVSTAPRWPAVSGQQMEMPQYQQRPWETQARDTDHATGCVAWRWLVDQILDLLRILATGGFATAAVVQVGQYFRERQRGTNRLAEIQAERDAEVAKIQANGLVQLDLERERSRALTSNQLSIGPPPPG
jgi:hypothetical protein